MLPTELILFLEFKDILWLKIDPYISPLPVKKKITIKLGHKPKETNLVRTISKRILTSFSDSPRYLEVRVDDETLKKVVPHSVATALASIVLPVPGGPTMSTPRHGRRMP